MTSRILLISMILLAWCGCIFEDENEDDKIKDPFQCESPKFSHDQLTVEFLQENFYEEDIKSCVVEGLG